MISEAWTWTTAMMPRREEREAAAIDDWIFRGGPGIAPLPAALADHVTSKDAKKPKKRKKPKHSKTAKKERKKEKRGKDAALVLKDCDLERTVAGVGHWGFHNAGQNCAAIERHACGMRIRRGNSHQRRKAESGVGLAHPGQFLAIERDVLGVYKHKIKPHACNHSGPAW